MNWKSTAVLVILAAAAGVWWWKHDELRPRLGLRPTAQPADPPALAGLEADLKPEHITEIKVTTADGTLVLNRTAAGWTQPENWGLRTDEVERLVRALTDLGVRFQPVPLPDGADLTAFGLADGQKPVTVTVTANGKKYELQFGEPPLKPGEAPFARPAYVRVNAVDGVKGANEVLRLGPNVMPVLRRPPEAYYRWQLFPDADRVKVAGAPPAPDPFGGPPRGGSTTDLTVPGAGVEEIRVSGPGTGTGGTAQWPGSGSFTLKRIGPNPGPSKTDKNAEAAVQPDRLAEAWAIEIPVGTAWGSPLSPVRERPSPATLQQVLGAVTELWAEEFVPAADARFAAEFPLLHLPLPGPLEPFPAAALRLHPALRAAVPVGVRTGLDRPERTVTVVTKGRATTVRIGGVARTVERDVPTTVPGPPGQPPQTITVKAVSADRYAQVEGNPTIFVVSGDKVDSLFASAGTLVDRRLVPVALDEVRAVTIAPPGGPPVTLTKKKGKPVPGAPPGFTNDQWLIDEKPNPVPADPRKVEELLARLLIVRSAPDRDLYRTDPNAKGLAPGARTTITLVAREKRPDDAPEAPPREYTVYVGAPDFAGGKVAMQLAGWPRVAPLPDHVGAPDYFTAALFPDRLSAFFAHPAVEYRDAKVVEYGESRPTAVTVTGAAGTFALKLEKEPGGPESWKLTAPVAHAADQPAATATVNAIDGLRATRFVRAFGLVTFALEAPRATATVTTQDGRTFTLEFGRARPPAPKKDPPPKADDPFPPFGPPRQPFPPPKFPPGFPQPGFPPPNATPPDQPEVYARLDGGAVFLVPTAAADALTAGLASAAPGAADVGALRLLPRQVWDVPVTAITAAEVARLNPPLQSFALTKDGTDWKLTGPFAATVPFLNAQPMLTTLGTLSATRYEALSAADPVKYGFDKPFAKVKLTYTEKAAGGERSVTKTVVIGGPTVPVPLSAIDVNSDRFARLDEPNAPVFVLSPGTLVAARTSPLDLPERNLVFLEAARVSRIQVTGQKPEDAVTLAKAQGVWKAEGDSFAVDADVVRQLIERLAPLPVERLAAYGDAVKWADYGLDRPEWTLTVALSGADAKTRKVQFGKLDPNGGRFVRVDDGPAVGVVPAAALPAFAHAKLDFVDRTLLTFEPDKFLGLVRARGKEEFEIALNAAGTGWDVLKPTKQKADQPLVDELTEALKRLRADRVVAVGKAADVYKTHGLEPAEATVTLTVGDAAETKTLRIGKPVDAAKPDGDRFVAVDTGTPDAVVGVLPAALANRLLAPAVSFRDRTLAKFVDADKLVLERGARKVTFAKVGGLWKVTDPVTADVSSVALDELVNDLAKLRAADWVADKPADLTPYGLDKPDAVWTVSQGDKVVLVLRVGKTAPDGRAFATAGTTGQIAVLGKEQTAKVLAEYRNRIVWPLSADPATAVEIAVGDGKAFTLTRGDTGWTDPGAPGAVISGPAVLELLNALAALYLERYAADANADLKAFGLDKPFATLKVTLKNGETRVLAVGSPVPGTDGKQRFARAVEKGRTDVFVLSAADTATVTRPRTDYLQKK